MHPFKTLRQLAYEHCHVRFLAVLLYRDAERTSRILASLMAAAQEAKDNSRAAGLVVNLSPGLKTMVKATQGAVEAARERVASLEPAGTTSLSG